MNDQDVERNPPEFPVSEDVGNGSRPGARESFIMAALASVFFIFWGYTSTGILELEQLFKLALPRGS